MSLLPDLLDLMPHSITLEAPTGTLTDFGERSFAAGVAYQCMIEPARGNTIIRSVNGEDRVASYTIYLATTADLDPESRLTLPTGYNPQQPPILSIARFSDEGGAHHVVVTV